MTTIALCVPHTPWVPERVKSMKRLRDALGGDFVAAKACGAGFSASNYHELTDRAPNQVWSVAMWKWMLDTGADFCLTLQDDCLVAPHFWPALRAMLTHLPRGHLLGLSGVHPMAAEVARRGHRWYRTTSWVIGWAYGMWREDLEAFLTWRLSAEGEAFTQRIAPNGEDAVINAWVGNAERDTWHPVPTIVDHDTSIDSSYANDDHGHRRPWVTWHRYHEADLVRPDFWLVNGSSPKHLHTVEQHRCWYCNKRKAVRASQETGAAICALCLMQTLGSIVQGATGQ